jgi:hypothetical protein
VIVTGLCSQEHVAGMVLRCTIWRDSQIPDTGFDKVRIEMAECVVSAHGPFR